MSRNFLRNSASLASSIIGGAALVDAFGRGSSFNVMVGTFGVETSPESGSFDTGVVIRKEILQIIVEYTYLML